MAWELSDDRPIYLQLMEHIQGDILSGVYPLGGKLPSVRDLAACASVNPNTMQKALSELERSGLLYSQRTSGRFVTEDEQLIQSLQASIAEKEIAEFPEEDGTIWSEKRRHYQTNKIAMRGMYMNYILECNNLSKVYSGFLALDRLNLKIPSGRIIGLLGPNGSGKSTLIKLINGLLTATEGEILFDSQPLGIHSREHISYLPDRMYLPEWMKIHEVFTYFDDFYKDFNKEKALYMLKDLGIDENKRLKTLSKGTKEKVQLILVMSRNAKLYLLDEPIAGVDPAARDYILKTIISNYNPDASLIISTHLISDIETVLDDVLFLQNGKITLSATVDQIREEKQKSVDQLFREVFKC